MNRSLAIIAHNLRSCHNVGSILRTADGLGLSMVYLTGHTPYPAHEGDERMPHIANKLTRQIHKTALGAETSQAWQHSDEIKDVIQKLRHDGYTIAALEQTKNSISLPDYKLPAKLAIIVGREVEGLETEILKQADVCVEIPMLGKKESYNVSQAAAMALFMARFA